jgi:hypothetical protein
VLVVLNDVWPKDAANLPIRRQDLLHPLSRLLVTTRDDDVLGPGQSRDVKLEVFDERRSEEAFYRHAASIAGSEVAISERKQGSGKEWEQLVARCGGFPLALGVIGAWAGGCCEGGDEAWAKLVASAAKLGDRPEIKDVLKLSIDILRGNLLEAFKLLAAIWDGRVFFRDEVVRGLNVVLPETGQGAHVVEELRSRNLLSVEVKEDRERIVIHDLMRQVAADGLEHYGLRRFVVDKRVHVALRPRSTATLSQNLRAEIISVVAEGVPLQPLQDLLLNCRNGPLQMLHFVHALQGLPDLANLAALRILTLRGCGSLRLTLPDMARLAALQTLDPGGRGSQRTLPDLAGLAALQTLDLRNCSRLTTLLGLAGLAALQTLDLRNCRSLTTLPELAGLAALQTLVLLGCRSLTTLPDLAGLAAPPDPGPARVLEPDDAPWPGRPRRPQDPGPGRAQESDDAPRPGRPCRPPDPGPARVLEPDHAPRPGRPRRPPDPGPTRVLEPDHAPRPGRPRRPPDPGPERVREPDDAPWPGRPRRPPDPRCYDCAWLSITALSTVTRNLWL